MQEKVLDDYFQMERWDNQLAACLLLGSEREGIMDAGRYAEESPFKYDWSHKHWQDAVYCLSIIISSEARHLSQKSKDRDLIPRRVAQWAFDNKARYPLDDKFLHYIVKHEERLTLSDCHWIDRHYAECIKDRYWSFEESKKILSGYPSIKIQHSGLLLTSSEMMAIEKALHWALMAGVIKEHGNAMLDGWQLVKWAKESGLLLPNKLSAAYKNRHNSISPANDEAEIEIQNISLVRRRSSELNNLIGKIWCELQTQHKTCNATAIWKYITDEKRKKLEEQDSEFSIIESINGSEIKCCPVGKSPHSMKRARFNNIVSEYSQKKRIPKPEQ